MKFEFLFEDIKSDGVVDEARTANLDTFYEWTKTAGKIIHDICDKDITLARSIPGIKEFKKYIDEATGQDNDLINVVLSLEKQYRPWINEVLDPKKSNKIYKETKIWIKDHSEPGVRGRKLGSTNKPKANVDKATQGLDFKPDQTTEPELSVAPKAPKEKKKYYVPTGNPRGPKPGSKRTPKDVSTKINPTDVNKVPLSMDSTQQPTTLDLINQMKAMQDQIEQLKNMVNKNQPPSDTSNDKIYESQNELKKQYKRFL
jgi:hypothetical protein